MTSVKGHYAGLALVAALTLATACRLAPPLTVTVDGSKVLVDIQTLGEYASSISRLRVTAAGGLPVWELVAVGTQAQLWKVELHAGANPARLSPEKLFQGEVKTLCPASSDTFTLLPGTSYTVEVWAPNGKRAVATFRLEPAR